jgi:hypothetical protein
VHSWIFFVKAIIITISFLFCFNERKWFKFLTVSLSLFGPIRLKLKEKNNKIKFACSRNHFQVIVAIDNLLLNAHHCGCSGMSEWERDSKEFWSTWGNNFFLFTYILQQRSESLYHLRAYIVYCSTFKYGLCAVK